MRICLLILSSFFLFAPAVFAQPDTMGTIELEATEQHRKPFPVVQDETIKYFGDFSEKLSGAGGGSLAAQPDLSEEEINYLTAAYLYCITKQGTCPMLLDALLEIDVLNSRLSRKAGCPNMLRFWKQWVGNDFEKRQKYIVPTGFLQQASDFNSRVRPSYIHCEDKVAAEIGGSAADQEFFRDRYQSGGKVRENFKKVVEYLTGVRANVANVFSALGAIKAGTSTAPVSE